ncbi:MAG: NUDIX hydrolase, partial [Candidatus Saccharibacteria bacterium]|nr:NUDIX hydrolase [Candidatus Saccharibacteria bacterium]
MSRGMQFGVKALINRGNGRYLFLKRSHPVYGETEPGWDIPGGRRNVDPHTKVLENSINGLAREVHEETKLVIARTGLRVAGVQEFFLEEAKLHVERTYFLTPLTPGNVILNPNEHSAFCDMTVEQALG